MTTEKKCKISAFARSIIAQEIDSLQQLISYIGDEFERVVEIIFECKGRVVISGIGKSAIIGQKIVATLNSTGTPSMFMHAADAMHGDLGMVQPSDVVIVISKSGNSPEIKVLVPQIANLGYNNIIIGMVGNLDSSLAKNSHLILNTTVAREACPMNLAPTSSTTMQLVMGDALAMALLHLRGYGNSEFAKVHPGGALGKQLLLKVGDLIHNERVPLVEMEQSVDEVIVEISSKRLGATAVVDKNRELKGIITDGDLRRMLQRKVDINTLKAKDIMSSNPKSIEKDELAMKAFSEMEKNKITQLLVVDSEKKYSGIIHIHDIIKEGV